MTLANIVTALYYKMNDPRFKLTPHKFKSLFEFDSRAFDSCFNGFYDEVNKLYSGKENERYIVALNCICGVKSLIYSRVESNSIENEFSTLYAFLNIININRSQIKDKQSLRDRLFKTFLFCLPSPEYIVLGTRLSPIGLIHFHKMNLEKELFDLTHLSELTIKLDFPEEEKAIKILNIALDYLTGKQLFLPNYTNWDDYAYYFFNPSDYINLYNYNRSGFYELMDKAVSGKMTFLKKAFIYNYNLLIIDHIDKIIELRDNLRCFDMVWKVLFFSRVVLFNQILSDIKLGNIKVDGIEP